VPCSDAGNVKDDSQVVTVIDFDGEHNHDNTGDLCSPFCHCHCCHSHTIEFELITFEPLHPPILKENFGKFKFHFRHRLHSLVFHTLIHHRFLTL